MGRREGEGVGRREGEEVGRRVVEWRGVEAEEDWDTADNRLFPLPPFLAPLTVIGISTS